MLVSTCEDYNKRCENFESAELLMMDSLWALALYWS
jgi:hypothetical protein